MTQLTLEEIAAAFRVHGTSCATARATGIPRTTLERRIARCVQDGILAREAISRHPGICRIVDGSPKAPRPAAHRKDESEKTRIRLTVAEQRARDAERRLKAQDVAEVEREAVLERLDVLLSNKPRTPDWVVSRSQEPGARIPVILLSDWHLGEVVSPDEIHGANSFNLAICRARVRELVAALIAREDFCGQEAGCVVGLLGDFVSGALHEELAATDELSVLQSIPEAVDLLEWALRTLADAFGAVYAPAACGNHGRVFDRRPRAKGYVHRNADWLIYALLQKRFQDDGRVIVEFNDANEVFFQVLGTRFMLAHGDHLGVKGGDGIIGSMGPIMRGALKVGRYSRSLGRDYDIMLIGHWHQPLWLPGVVVNGALKGWDEYASRVLKAPYAPPSQSVFVVEEGRGICERIEIELGRDDPDYFDNRISTDNAPGWLSGKRNR